VTVNTKGACVSWGGGNGAVTALAIGE
jgi:hypothetical protein